MAKKSTPSRAKTITKIIQNDANDAAEKTVAGPKIMPLGDRVLVKPILASDLAAKNSFGIIIPDTASKEQPEQGFVVAVGDGRHENGKHIAVKVKVGDKVIFSKYGFDEVKMDDAELYIIKEENILAVIKK